METYIAFLRGINVGGQKKIKMAELKASLEGGGIEGLQTYIQSGNLVFKSELAHSAPLANEIKDKILDRYGFEVPVLVMTLGHLQAIHSNNPYLGTADGRQLYFVLLAEAGAPDRVKAFEQMHFENEEFEVTDHCVYLNCLAGYGKAKLSNNLVERKLGVAATARNLKTIEKMIALAADP